MNNPILSNFGNGTPEPRSFWKRWGWLVLLGILAVVFGGWYAASIFIQPTPELIIPTTPPKNNPMQAVPANYAGPKLNGKAYPYTEAKNHIGESTGISGTVVKVFTSSTNTTFLDFCATSKTCPFTAIVFKEDVSKLPNLTKYQGKSIIVSGIVRLYNGQAEIIISDPLQIWPQ